LEPAPRTSPGAPTSAGRGGGRLWVGLLGLVVSAGFLYWALRGVRPAEFFADLESANIPLYLTSVALATLTFPARAFRWRIILASGGPGVRWTPVWHATAIGFMATNLLPARAGELARAYAASRFVGVPLARSIGSIAVERVFDGLIIVLLLALAIATFHVAGAAAVRGTTISTIAAWTGALFIVLLGLLFFLVHAPREALAWLAAVVRRVLPARAAEFVVRVTRSFIDGLTILRSPFDFTRVVAWSFAVWLINAAAFYAAFLAFHLGPLPLTSPLLLQGIVAVGVAIPSSPGFIGVFEGTAVFALGLYGVARTPAASMALGTHIGWFIPITAIGLWRLARSGLSLRDITTAEAAP
jgi:glycosyltransferase 2 family protein